MWKVGHSLIKAKMKEENADLAGEMSGHMFFADRWFGFDDAVYAGMRLVELLTRSKQTLAELYDTLPVLSTRPRSAMTCPDDLKFEVVKRAQAWFRERYEIVDIDGVRIQFQEGRHQERRLGADSRVEHRRRAGAALRGRQQRAARARSRPWSKAGSRRSWREMGAPPPQIAAH